MSEQHPKDTTLEFSRRAVVAGIASVGALVMSPAAPARAEITKADFLDMPATARFPMASGRASSRM
jgi:hypothetical protein